MSCREAKRVPTTDSSGNRDLLQLLFYFRADVNALEDPGGESWTALPRREAIVISRLLTTHTELMVTCSHRVVKQGDRGKESVPEEDLRDGNLAGNVAAGSACRSPGLHAQGGRVIDSSD